MRDSSLNPAATEFDLARLDEMIAALGRFRDVDLLKEHLQGARQYLMGAMPEEYLLNLEWARQALDTVPDGDIRSHLDDTIAKLIAGMAAAPRTD
jgi:hypothetical protein